MFFDFGEILLGASFLIWERFGRIFFCILLEGLHPKILPERKTLHFANGFDFCEIFLGASFLTWGRFGRIFVGAFCLKACLRNFCPNEEALIVFVFSTSAKFP